MKQYKPDPDETRRIMGSNNEFKQSLEDNVGLR